MRLRSWFLPAVVPFLLAQAWAQTSAAAPPPAPAAPATLRWSEGDKSSEAVVRDSTYIEVLHGPTMDVAVSLSDLHDYATRAWVQVLNHGAGGIALDPEKATLQIVKPKPKTLPVIKPEKLASDIKRLADVDAADRSSAGCPYLGSGCSQNSSGVASAKEVQQLADAIIEDVRDTGLRPGTVQPNEQVQGAIFFRFESRKEECVFRIPIADWIFEFPIPVGRKKK